MDCTICANEVSRRGGFSATRVPVSRGGRNLWPGELSPGPPSTTSAPERGTARTSFVPREPGWRGYRQATAVSRPRTEMSERPTASRSVGRCSAVTERRSTPSRRDRWYGSDPAGRAAWACTCRTAPMPIEACRDGGRSRPRPGETDRQRRSAGRGPTPTHPATCGTGVPHARSEFRCTSTPMSNSHLWIGNGLCPRRSNFGLREDGSNAMSNGRRSCVRDARTGAVP